jgi:hypothetical protein
VPTAGDAAPALARRLRALRKSHWPDVSITQADLANALSSRKPTSVQLISSWERELNPSVPPEDRLNAIATFFSTRRSRDGKKYRLVSEADLTIEEAAAREELRHELLQLRRAAITEVGLAQPARERVRSTIVGRGPWHFEGETDVSIFCTEIPEDKQKDLHVPGLSGPDRPKLWRFADLDALFELHGHIRAVNPDLDVRYREASRMESDTSTEHWVALGGVDWNLATKEAMRLTGVPVRQRSDDKDPSRGCFQVVENGKERSFAPVFEDRGSERVLIEDVGHFLRAPNPLNRASTVTVCNGMYGSGVFGAVRTLTDKKFRDLNADYLAEVFDGIDTFSLLFRVRIVNGVVVTPDWTAPGTVLHTWPEAWS